MPTLKQKCFLKLPVLTENAPKNTAFDEKEPKNTNFD